MALEAPNNEFARLKALESTGILHTAPEAEFDEIARRVAKACDTPIGLITFLTADTQWMKSAHGIDLKETTREVSFCTWAIHSEEVMCVEDASRDDRFQDNPLVVQAPNIRYYAGAPISTPEGYLLGAVCVMDHKPRLMEDEHRAALKVYADQVSHALAQRRRAGGGSDVGASL